MRLRSRLKVVLRLGRGLEVVLWLRRLLEVAGLLHWIRGTRLLHDRTLRVEAARLLRLVKAMRLHGLAHDGLWRISSTGRLAATSAPSRGSILNTRIDVVIGTRLEGTIAAARIWL